MTTPHKELALELTRFVAEQHAPKDVRRKALETKIEISQIIRDLYQTLWLVDVLVSTFAPDPSWQTGLLEQTGITQARSSISASMPSPLRSPSSKLTTKPSHILEVAMSLISGSSKEVTSKSIAERLKQEGDQRPDDAIKIAVGNVLSRGGWEKVSPGKYRVGESSPEEVK